MDIVENEGISLSVNCPFHPENDLFFMIDENYRIKRNRFKCKICSATLREEEEIYYHIIDNHREVIKEHVCFYVLNYSVFIYWIFLERGCLFRGLL